jgi:DMSO/TMAO reductase YedYZ heme-binding membrane subunit
LFAEKTPNDLSSSPLALVDVAFTCPKRMDWIDDRNHSPLGDGAMSLQYVPVKWNRNKLIYDAIILAGIVLYLLVFLLVGRLLWTGSIEVLLIRALGTCAFIMLHIVLSIGPLARLDARFLPVLYNRRHLGVATFIIAFLHGTVSTGYYHGFGTLNPLLSLLTSNTNYGSLSAFPFEILGLIPLVILFLMAATSHDFWLKNLSPSIWKSLHMLVYPAYVLLVWHVLLGVLRSEQGWLSVIVTALGVTIVTSLHLICGFREWSRDRRGV